MEAPGHGLLKTPIWKATQRQREIIISSSSAVLLITGERRAGIENCVKYGYFARAYLCLCHAFVTGVLTCLSLCSFPVANVPLKKK